MKRHTGIVMTLAFLVLAACSGGTTGLFGQIDDGPVNVVDVAQLAYGAIIAPNKAAAAKVARRTQLRTGAARGHCFRPDCGRA